jgi:hypothetical protein
MNRTDALRKLAEFDGIWDTIEALHMLSNDTEGTETSWYMLKGAEQLESLYEFIDALILTGVKPAEKVTE